jgi:hypothetical protein
MLKTPMTPSLLRTSGSHTDAQMKAMSGEYFYHMEKRDPLPAARDVSIQDRLLDFCSRATGMELPS